MGKKYLSRVGSLIRYHITRLLLESSNDERLQQVNITDVVVNRDTTRAEVFYSLLGSAEERVEVQAALDKAAGWLRSELAPVLRLRNLPQLVFAFDPSLIQGERIEALLSQLQADGVLQPEPSAPMSAAPMSAAPLGGAVGAPAGDDDDADAWYDNASDDGDDADDDWDDEDDDWDDDERDEDEEDEEEDDGF